MYQAVKLNWKIVSYINITITLLLTLWNVRDKKFYSTDPVEQITVDENVNNESHS